MQKTILIALITGGLVMGATTSMAQEIETEKAKVLSAEKAILTVSSQMDGGYDNSVGRVIDLTRINNTTVIK